MKNKAQFKIDGLKLGLGILSFILATILLIDGKDSESVLIFIQVSFFYLLGLWSLSEAFPK